MYDAKNVNKLSFFEIPTYFCKKNRSLYNSTLLSMYILEHFFEVNGLCFMMILLDQLKKGFFKHEDEN